jgi:hypothetical protein
MDAPILGWRPLLGSDSFVMVSPFFAIRILKNRLWRIVLYSYIHNGDSKGDYSFLKGGIPSDISSPPERIAFHRGDTSVLSSYQSHGKEIQMSKFKCQMNDKCPNVEMLDL